MALKDKTRDVKKSPTAQREEAAGAANRQARPLNAAAALRRAADPRPSALRPADIRVLQRTIGNRAVGRILGKQPGAPPPQTSTPADAIQLKTEDEEPRQAKFETGRVEENRTGLPDRLKSGVESLSGISLDGVNVHYNSPRPARLNALAYTQGGDIYVAPGHERHLPHEAWHVVQQARGRVRPTMQLKDGVSVNDDEGLEHEADVMGAKALTHTGGEPPVSPTPKAGGLSVGSSAGAPVQRLIGFEVEYQVPTFGHLVEAVELRGGENPPDVMLKYFLFGGYGYGTQLGGSAKPGENSFRLTTDHNKLVTREPVRAKLASMGKLDPDNVQDRDASSNLEYVTSPVDELAKGSDKVLNDLIDKVANHATSTFTVANGQAGKIPAPAADAETGTPIEKFRAWLSAEDYGQLKPTLRSFWDNILDSCYIQATIGVIPGGVGTLMEKAADEGGLHATGDKFTHIYAALKTASDAAALGVKDHEYLKKLRKDNEAQTLSALSGMIKLLVMYLVGEALSQTSAFPGGSIKNAVPFLVKIDPAKIADAGPTGMILFDTVPDDFVTKLAAQISGRKEITVQYWRDLGYAARERKVEDKVTVGTVENLTKMFLQGKKPEGTGAQTGSQLKKLDPMKEISGVLSHNEGQTGIPLEYRYVKARPAAAGLKAELLKIVEEAREVNLSQSSEQEKLKIRNQVKE